LFGAVLKINAYSYGLAEAAEILYQNAGKQDGVDYFMVEKPEEALALRLQSKIPESVPILILYRTVMAPSLLCKLALLHIRVSALAIEWLLSLNLNDFCPPSTPALKFHAMLDTGLSREGLRLEETVSHLADHFYPLEKGIRERKLQ
ncbi:unnamed protein product, partial [Amoebophrya sp. A120]